MPTRYAVVNESTGLVCHFGPCADFATREEALIAMLYWTPATPEYVILAVDGNFAPAPHPFQPPTPELPA